MKRLFLALALALFTCVAQAQFNVKTFGAKCDGVTNDAAAITAAVKAALGSSLSLPAGTCLVNSEIPVLGSITIFGAGREITIVKLGGTTQNGFNVTTDGPVHFRDFQIIGAGAGAATAGAGIKVNGATAGVTSNGHSTFNNLGFVFNWHGIEITSAYAERINGNQFFGILDAGIVKQDLTFPDSGDGWITENFFTGNSTSATLDGIRHFTGGGLKIDNNAFIGLGTAYRMSWNSTTGSSQIFLQGNTVDRSMQVGGFIFDRTAAGTVFAISIKNNFFDTNVAAAPSIWFKTNNATVFTQVTISGNTHLVATGGTGIQIDGGAAYSIVGEQFVANSTGTGIATGNATAASIFVGKNQFNGITTPFAINTITQILGADLIADGAVGTPSLAFFNSPATGFYQPAPDQVGIAVAGAQRGLFSSSGLTLANGTILTPGGVPISLSSGNGNVNPASDVSTTFGTGSFRWLQVNTPSVINTAGVTVTGTNTNNSAAVGDYGEFITATAAPAAVALTTNTSANVTSVSLTAGDWDCAGAVNFTYGATTSITNLAGGASQVSATLPTQDNRFDSATAAQVPTAGAIGTYPIPMARQLLAGTTTIFLVAQGTFTVSTLAAGGTLRCRRMR